jgi:hypothetical protein
MYLTTRSSSTIAYRFVRVPRPILLRSRSSPICFDHSQFVSVSARICARDQRATRGAEIAEGAHAVLEALGARPAAHDERVVRGDDGDDVDGLVLKRVVVLHEPGHVLRVARRRERARHREQHDAPAFPRGDLQLLRDAARELRRAGVSARGWWAWAARRTASSSSGPHGTWVKVVSGTVSPTLMVAMRTEVRGVKEKAGKGIGWRDRREMRRG